MTTEEGGESPLVRVLESLLSEEVRLVSGTGWAKDTIPADEFFEAENFRLKVRKTDIGVYSSHGGVQVGKGIVGQVGILREIFVLRELPVEVRPSGGAGHPDVPYPGAGQQCHPDRYGGVNAQEMGIDRVPGCPDMVEDDTDSETPISPAISRLMDGNDLPHPWANYLSPGRCPNVHPEMGRLVAFGLKPAASGLPNDGETGENEVSQLVAPVRVFVPILHAADGTRHDLMAGALDCLVIAAEEHVLEGFFHSVTPSRLRIFDRGVLG